MTALALDTSVSVPLLITSHGSHGAVRQRLAGRELVLTTHSLAETYSVLTRLPGDARLAAPDAARLINANFGVALAAPPDVVKGIADVLADRGIVGGAVYDALVALAAHSHDCPLATRDARAVGTYAAVGVRIEIINA